MLGIVELASHVTQPTTKLGMPDPDGHDTDGAEDPKMAILSAGILLLILSGIAYAAFKNSCEREESRCGRLLNWLSARSTSATPTDAATPGNSV